MLDRFFNKKGSRRALPANEVICAVGDIHGRLDLLDQLLAKIQASTQALTPRMVFLGDYVDRGPDTKGVLDRLIELGGADPRHKFLRGNHEAALLDFLDHPDDMTDWLEWGGEETLISYGVSLSPIKSPADLAEDLRDAMPDTHAAFLRALETKFLCGEFLFVHAGIRPGVPLEEQNEKDLLWIRKSFHNAPAKNHPPYTVVHGHQPVKTPQDLGWRINVDSGAVWSDKLSSVLINGADRRFITT
ncbi:MAG: metallophosphoesterase family protein [Pseudomonadota bacterium]